jgi:hypothetical protein
VVGDLLIALVNVGATATSPPICTECGKALRTLLRPRPATVGELR